MATLCSPGCIPLCDFCEHYNFNANEKGYYIGNGWCTLHNRSSEPYDDCEDFYCFLINKVKEN